MYPNLSFTHFSLRGGRPQRSHPETGTKGNRNAAEEITVIELRRDNANDKITTTFSILPLENGGYFFGFRVTHHG
jgi:hypothetical protein